MTITAVRQQGRSLFKLYRLDGGLYLRGHTRGLDAALVVHELKARGIRHVVCLAPRAHDELRNAAREAGIRYTHKPFADGNKIPEQMLLPLARLLASEIKGGGCVMVHCNAGRNRSALLAALILVNLGWTAEAALPYIRRVRPRALANPAFAAYLESGSVW